MAGAEYASDQPVNERQGGVSEEPGGAELIQNSGGHGSTTTSLDHRVGISEPFIRQ